MAKVNTDKSSEHLYFIYGVHIDVWLCIGLGIVGAIMTAMIATALNMPETTEPTPQTWQSIVEPLNSQ